VSSNRSQVKEVCNSNLRGMRQKRKAVGQCLGASEERERKPGVKSLVGLNIKKMD